MYARALRASTMLVVAVATIAMTTTVIEPAPARAAPPGTTDFGDAPASYGTLEGGGGAAHVIFANEIVNLRLHCAIACRCRRRRSGGRR